KGEFREASARLTVAGERAQLEGSAKVDSLDVKDENFAAHLQSPDFFDAERHPELRFGADDVAVEGGNVKARGEITIKGVTEDVELEIYEALKDVPPFDEDDESAPAPAVAHLRDAIAGADAILFATPEYNSSIPGQLKNAVDWASRPVAAAPLRNKPVAVVGA